MNIFGGGFLVKVLGMDIVQDRVFSMQSVLLCFVFLLLGLGYRVKFEIEFIVVFSFFFGYLGVVGIFVEIKSQELGI